MVLLEGLTLDAIMVPQWQLYTVWRTISSTPLSRVKALLLSDDAFNNILRNRDCIEDPLREIEESGYIFNAAEVGAADYVILIHQNLYHTFSEILLHKLVHILQGDL